MATNFIQPGRAITVTAAAAATSGAVVAVGSIIGVAANTAAIGDALDIETEGVWELPKVAANTFTVGAPAYWAAGTGLVTSTATDNTKLGVAVAAAGAGAGTVKVRLNGAF
jgi:predicted RecA/RadA family phage recombinase